MVTKRKNPKIGRPGRDVPISQLTIRIDSRLFDALAAEAKGERRSLSAQAEKILEERYGKESGK